MTFMTHPQHGANNVSPSDVATQEKAGWKVTDRAEWMATKGKPPGYSAGLKPFRIEDEVIPTFPVVRNKPGPKPKAR